MEAGYVRGSKTGKKVRLGQMVKEHLSHRKMWGREKDTESGERRERTHLLKGTDPPRIREH